MVKNIRDEIINKVFLTTFLTSHTLSKWLTCVAIFMSITVPVSAQEAVSPNSISPSTTEQSIQANTIPDEVLLKEYERLKIMTGDKEYRVAHIMVKNKNAAEKIIERIKKGESFAELAEVYSTDSGSARKGGDLGWKSASAFTPNFARAVKSTESGTYTTEPVLTEFGWHIIKIDAVRPLHIPPFEEVKESIRASLQRKQPKQSE